MADQRPNMKIALFIPTLSGGGVERTMVRLARRLVVLGHQVDMLTFSGAGSMRREAEEVARVFDLEASRWIRRTISYLSYIWREDPDIVIAATSVPNTISCLVNGLLSRKRPVIISQHGWEGVVYDRQKRWKHEILQKITRAAYKRAEALAAVSSGVATQLAKIPGLKEDRIHVIYNPVWNPEIDLLAREPLPCAWSMPAKLPTLISVGRLEEEKDFITLLYAFAAVRSNREARLVLLGEGSLRPALEDLARRLGVMNDLSMPGFVENPFPYVARANVLALCSIREGLPTVLIEAMACGTPVVSTDCPSGPSEILEGGRYGPLVPVGDADALAAAIEHQLDDPTPAELLKARARDFSVEVSAASYLRLAGSLMAKR